MIADENAERLVPVDSTLSHPEKEVDLAPEELVPRLTKPGYYCEPSLTKLCRMSEQELANIEDFTICNEYGKIILDGKTDVRGLDLDELVNIKNKTVIKHIDFFSYNTNSLGGSLSRIFYRKGWKDPRARRGAQQASYYHLL